jgi:hypothetical protein
VERGLGVSLYVRRIGREQSEKEAQLRGLMGTRRRAAANRPKLGFMASLSLIMPRLNGPGLIKAIAENISLKM